ncbi:hypothetical protein SeMB42_g02712 [Synchytrium endobioticum]|uniref:protein kinase C n=1 Tax=Synchytrium endobioticum TaxID=286115 RepID=A0A507DC44_9FUNG|nr:hypothetical protein SeMB42_g02712 [Synchytrium endobioticum]
MLPQLKDQNALEQCQVTISEAQRRLDFLEGESKRLTAKKWKGASADVISSSNSALPDNSSIRDSIDTTNSASSSTINNGPMRESPAFMQRATALFRSTHHLSSPGSVRRSVAAELASSQPNLSSLHNQSSSTNQLHSSGASIMASLLSNLGLNKSSAAIPRPASTAASSDNLAPPLLTSPVKGLSSFDYLRHDTAISAQQVRYKLKSVEQKLDVEAKVKAGTEKLYQAVMRDPDQDKRRQQEVAAKKEEADARVLILQKALQRYRGLYVEEDEDLDSPDLVNASQCRNGSMFDINTQDDSRQNCNAATIDTNDKQQINATSGHVSASATVHRLSTNDPPDSENVDGPVPLLTKSSSPNLRPTRSMESPSSGHSDLDGDAANRKPMTGRLRIKLIGANNLPGKTSHKTETYAIIRIDGAQRARTKQSRSRWGEDLDIVSDKATECEVAVYEKGGAILALVWFRLSELEDFNRIRTSVTSVPPAVLNQNGSRTRESTVEVAPSRDSVDTAASERDTQSNGVTSLSMERNGTGDSSPAETSDVVFKDNIWVDMEPAGQLCMRLSFVPESRILRRRNEGVMRRKPVQRGKVMRGHKFVPITAYSVMKCAICLELFVNSGYSCAWCKYACHKKCYTKSITKCITKGDQEEKGEEEENASDLTSLALHRIPHRFEPFTNIGTSWCCHCGLILAIGRGKALKCTECSFASHKECMPLIPNLCGLAPGVAFQIVQAVDTAEKVRSGKNRLPRDDSSNFLTSYSMAQLQAYDKNSTAASSQELYTPSAGSTADKMTSLSSNLSKIIADSKISETVPPATKQQSQTEIQASAVPTSTSQNESNGALNTSNHAPAVPWSDLLTLSAAAPVTEEQQVMNQTVMASTAPSNRSKVPSSGPKGIGLEDFQFLAVLGKGNFGKVMLAEDKYTKGLYAIKVLKKQFILENDEVESTKSEKRVFLIANKERHPFLVNLHSCFQTESRIYFVMEYVSGGDLMWHIQKQQFSEKRAKFYACEVLLALEYFHKNNIVYRDLKLDNILLTLDGHLKIADYGLCKENMPYGATTSTFCGTPEFMAPEILQDKPYGRAVDWWALGVLIYEMLLGQSPFRGDDEDEIFEAILEDEILYPVTMQKDAVTLLQKLLCKDPSRRLGAGKADAEDIKKHPFFKGVDWDAMLNLKVPPPFYPTVSSPTDVSNFDDEFTREIPQLTPCPSALTAVDQEEFRGFTHVSNWAMEERQKHGFVVPPPKQKPLKLPSSQSHNNLSNPSNGTGHYNNSTSVTTAEAKP